MTLNIPDERISRTADLLRSLEESVGNLRRQAEALRRRIEVGEDADLLDGSKQVAKLDSLIGSCQKVEVKLAEYHDKRVGIAQGSHALDLEAARSEIGGRLARLRARSDP